MARNLNDLANTIASLNARIETAASDKAKEVTLAIVQDLVNKTPVDTSNALSNWQVTLDAPADNEIKPYFPGSFGSTQRSSAAQTVNEAVSKLGAKKPGQSIFITNNAPYIEQLNNGSSKQQPAGFVERAILIGRKLISKFKVN